MQTFNINPQLLENALKITGLNNQEDVITMALNQLLQTEKQKKLLALEGKINWQGNLEQWRDSFWQTKTLKQLEEQQGNKAFKKSTVYQADFLPETETTDDWLHYFAVQHQQDKAGL